MVTTVKSILTRNVDGSIDGDKTRAKLNKKSDEFCIYKKENQL